MGLCVAEVAVVEVVGGSWLLSSETAVVGGWFSILSEEEGRGQEGRELKRWVGRSSFVEILRLMESQYIHFLKPLR